MASVDPAPTVTTGGFAETQSGSRAHVALISGREGDRS